MLGAWLRWGLGLWLNPLHATLPAGTLVANLTGGYMVGFGIAWFAQHPGLSPEWRLFSITGFLGGLTTFSTFSAELFTMMTRGQMLWALAAAVAHLLGSLAMTALGVLTYNLLKG